jgi:conjugative transfer signal peptidase TraF
MSRVGLLSTMVLAMLAIGLPTAFHPAPWLIWNASASTAIGLYAVHPAGKLHISDLVVATPPDPLAAFFAQRRYLPKGVPLLKHVVALPGQTVCRVDPTIAIDGLVEGLTLEHDRRGRPLPVWRGCRVVAASEVFLMNRRPDSLDSRYFGPLPITSIVGRAAPLWTETEK